jgi:uracil-DNA glycosylase family protein
MPATRRARASKAGEKESLEQLRLRAATCKRCDLWKSGTQTVFGAGPARADLMLVGEQPGDVEDRRGEPFVGPAGQLLRKALAEAGIDERRVYLTNAVKHFKWTPRGKRRIHERPNHEEVLACHLWLEAEIAQVKPRILVALGATAAAALLGSTVRVTRDRARTLDSPLADVVTVTVHPSSILRSPDSESRAAAFAQFVGDLRRIVQLSPAGGASPTRTRKS